MKKLSRGSFWALVAILFITLLGVFYTIKDYRAHGDLLNIWWPIIGVVIFLIVLWRSLRTDNRLTALALLLLAGGLYSCKPTETAKSEGTTEKQVAYEPRTETYTDAEGYDRTVNAEREW